MLHAAAAALLRGVLPSALSTPNSCTTHTLPCMRTDVRPADRSQVVVSCLAALSADGSQSIPSSPTWVASSAATRRAPLPAPAAHEPAHEPAPAAHESCASPAASSTGSPRELRWTRCSQHQQPTRAAPAPPPAARCRFWVIIGLIGLFLIVGAYFTWRGFKQWKLHKQREAAFQVGPPPFSLKRKKKEKKKKKPG